MQPYQKATEEILRQGELPKDIPKNVASTALKVGGTAIAGKTLAEKVLALVNKYVPEDLAIKGLNKIDSRFGTFIKKALGAGESFNEVREFISEQAKNGMEENEPKNPKENRNIVEQYSPELHQFILDQIGSGRSPLEAAAIATLGSKKSNFKNIIDKIVKENKSPWSAIVQSIYGSEKTAAKQPESQPKQEMQQQVQAQGSEKWNQIAKSLQDIINS